jgi:S-disulfanyl-L-cysteine oxidoreductase SoxD
MRFNYPFVLAVALAACAAASAQTTKYQNVGKTATPEEIKAEDITVFGPTGKGLPPGHGTAKEGAPLFAGHCAMCHGATAEGGPLASNLVDGPNGGRAATSWPFAPSIWGYIRRAMPRYNERTLTSDQIYAITAWLLYRGGIIKEDEVMDAKTLAEVKMPHRNDWVPENLDDLANLKKRGGYNGQYPGPDPTTGKVDDLRRVQGGGQ